MVQINRFKSRMFDDEFVLNGACKILVRQRSVRQTEARKSFLKITDKCRYSWIYVRKFHSESLNTYLRESSYRKLGTDLAKQTK